MKLYKDILVAVVLAFIVGVSVGYYAGAAEAVAIVRENMK